ncbi:MAG: alpha-amylase/4-alpha-glucanotransferase domain-containing protein [Acidimicrobiia bacterium]
MNLVFAAHRHQPLGNLPGVINDACDREYLPFLEALADHPGIRINLHYSGALLEWLDENRPDVLETLASRAGQIEWIGGAFYNPILPSLPAQDALAHLSLLSKFLQDHFDQTPRGVWLAEGSWDPGLPSLLHNVGMEYTLLDELAFELAGYSPHDLTDSFLTDHLGNTLTIFPIARDLRDAVRRADPDALMALLRDRHERDPQTLAVLSDDDERSSLSPQSPQQVDGREWLGEFFARVEEADWLEMVTFESYLDDHPAGRRAAIPSASYRRISEWSPIPGAAGISVGAHEGLHIDRPVAEASRWAEWWPNFLIDHPEAAVVYRKMLRVSAHVAAGKEASDAHTELLKAQGEDHYQRSGLYSPHLRATVNRRLINAQVMIDASHHRGRAWTYIRHLDWDADGREEIEVELPDQAWVLDPAEGGSLLYYDDKPSRWSIGDVVTESHEPHLVELPETLFTGSPAHRWLIDHLLPSSSTVESFGVDGSRELLSLWTTNYEIEKEVEGRGSARIETSALEGAVRKTIEAEDRILQIGYRIAGLPEGRFGPELPVAIWEGAGEIRSDGGEWQKVDQPLALAGHRFRLRHNGLKTYLLVALRQPGSMFCVPIRTVARSEAGTGAILQGIVLWPHWSTNGEGHYELTIETGDMDKDPA